MRQIRSPKWTARPVRYLLVAEGCALDEINVRSLDSQQAIFCFFMNNELTKVGSDQRSSTIQYDSKSKHSKRRQTVH